jgi:hypothetical protein
VFVLLSAMSGLEEAADELGCVTDWRDCLQIRCETAPMGQPWLLEPDDRHLLKPSGDVEYGKDGEVIQQHR